MIEAAVLVDRLGAPLAWHLPPGRSATAIPDSRDLWESMWTHREILGGLAHTHPGSGEPHPSREDLTTFAACEAALGIRLDWWIATSDRVIRYRWTGPYDLTYTSVDPLGPTPWLDQLRIHSTTPEGGEP